MYHATLKKQKGISLSGLLIWSVVLIMLAVLGMKLTPVYIEYAAVKKTLAAIMGDPNLKDAMPREIRQSFNKRATIDNIKEVRGGDIKISKEKGKTVLKVDYSVTTPLFANISLLIDFKATSD